MRELPGVKVWLAQDIAANAGVLVSRAFTGSGLLGISMVAAVADEVGIDATLSIEVCNTPPASVSTADGPPTDAVWATPPVGSGATSPIMGAGGVAVAVNGLQFRWYRFRLVTTAGAGHITGYVYAYGPH